MDMQLQGKSAIVTGATAGIGLAIARSLAREGVAVTITGRSRGKLDAAAADIVSAAPGSAVTTVVADQSTAEGVAALIAVQPDTDILVNNLGYCEAETAPRPGMSDPEIEAHFLRTYRPSSLIARMIEADEIAAMVTLLASPLGAASNGAAVRVEGGTFRSIL